jgi:hypothetical protein
MLLIKLSSLRLSFLFLRFEVADLVIDLEDLVFDLFDLEDLVFVLDLLEVFGLAFLDLFLMLFEVFDSKFSLSLLVFSLGGLEL